MNNDFNAVMKINAELTYREWNMLDKYMGVHTISKPGYTKLFSKITILNADILYNVNKEIIKSITEFRKDYETTEYNEAYNKALLAHADRDEQGEIIYNPDKSISVKNEITELEADIAALEEKYKDSLEKAKNYEADLNDYLNTHKLVKELYVCKDFDDYPETLPPELVDILFNIHNHINKE